MQVPGETRSNTSQQSSNSRQSNRWARAHGYALSLGLGVALLIASVVLIAVDRDANFLVAGGTVLLVIGAMAGRLTHFKVGKEGIEADISDHELAHELRKAEAAIESQKSSDEPEIDPASVLEAAAEALSAPTSSEKSKKVLELRHMTSPMARREADVIDWVMTLERAAGRRPQLQSSMGPGDIVSPPRTIEVKAVRSRSSLPFLRLTEREATEAESDPNFFLYVVEVPESESSPFHLRVFGGENLRRLIQQARRRSWLEIPLRRPEFLEAPGAEALRHEDPHGTGA